MSFISIESLRSSAHQAVQGGGGRPNTLQRIIDSGVDVNSIDDNGDTALHLELRK
ncbi:MAG: ankyrin repeat domain-containing protein, partial [Myxococcales bacterium]|nr:ankyrin repeat domain-containing protein [Myxococcales bacterium]